MLPYIIKAALHTYSFFGNLSRVPADHDLFATLLSPTMRNDIRSFVDRHLQSALLSQERRFSLQSRFCVTLIGLKKARMPDEHESLAIWVYDKYKLSHHEFVMECVPAPGLSYASQFSIFCSFPRSDEVLNSLTMALRNMRTTTSDSVPLLPLTKDPMPPTVSSSLRANTPCHTALPFIDIVTSSLVEAVAEARLGSQSIPPGSLTGDTISGRPPQTLMVEDCIRRFNPVGLSLFDIALLGKVLHEYAPMYGLFENHCYMFASVMFDAIVQLRSLPRSTLDPAASTSTPVPAPTPEVGPPKNANYVVLPDCRKAGRWYNLLILDPIVKTTIVSIVINEFEKRREVYMRELDQHHNVAKCPVCYFIFGVGITDIYLRASVW